MTNFGSPIKTQRIQLQSGMWDQLDLQKCEEDQIAKELEELTLQRSKTSSLNPLITNRVAMEIDAGPSTPPRPSTPLNQRLKLDEAGSHLTFTPSAAQKTCSAFTLSELVAYRRLLPEKMPCQLTEKIKYRVCALSTSDQRSQPKLLRLLQRTCQLRMITLAAFSISKQLSAQGETAIPLGQVITVLVDWEGKMREDQEASVDRIDRLIYEYKRHCMGTLIAGMEQVRLDHPRAKTREAFCISASRIINRNEVETVLRCGD